MLQIPTLLCHCWPGRLPESLKLRRCRVYKRYPQMTSLTKPHALRRQSSTSIFILSRITSVFSHSNLVSIWYRPGGCSNEHVRAFRPSTVSGTRPDQQWKSEIRNQKRGLRATIYLDLKQLPSAGVCHSRATFLPLLQLSYSVHSGRTLPTYKKEL